jgi:uncharacterized membrane protein SirB2
MSVRAEERRVTPWKASAVTVVSVLVVAVSLTWVYLVMRSVMNVGGSCADGGPYVSAQPCPDGTVLMAVGVPVLIIFAMIGTVSASSVGAPNLLVPMWGVLFGTLGWNFLEYAFIGPDIVWGWLVCGVMFWAMALPAFVFMIAQFRTMVRTPQQDRSWLWLPAYGFLGAVGVLVGWWSFTAIAT